jgi:hypothetical protein
VFRHPPNGGNSVGRDKVAEQNVEVHNTFVYAFITYLDGEEERLSKAMDQLHSLSEKDAKAA